MNKNPGVYILQSTKNHRYYVGSTNNIERRFEEHQRGKVRATKYLTPVELKIFFPVNTLKAARQIEFRIKKLKSKNTIEKIIKDKKIIIANDYLDFTCLNSGG
jgi:putative endonuclease